NVLDGQLSRLMKANNFSRLLFFSQTTHNILSDKDRIMDKIPNEIRFGDFLNEIAVNHAEISYQQISSLPGASANSAKQKLELRPMDVYRLLAPYVGTRFYDQAKAVIPLALYLGLFQYFILNRGVQDSGLIAAG